MNTIEIRANFHQLIDQINNEQLLIKLYHIMEQAIATADGKLWSRLSDDEQIELLRIEGEVQSDQNLIANGQMLEERYKQSLKNPQEGKSWAEVKNGLLNR